MRKNIVAGNWKMNCDMAQTQILIEALERVMPAQVNCEVMIAPSTPFLFQAFNLTKGLPIEVVAQNASAHESGAHTGETSLDMLASLGIKTVIIGHSERRDSYGENDAIIKAKVHAVIAKDMRVIFCCGEHLETRKAGNHITAVTQQVEKALFDLTPEQMKQVVVAYEPVWAIGTGETASPEQAQDMHAAIREFIANKFGSEIANETSILYGGSVKDSNAAELFAKPDVDGGLVGGASLDAENFAGIIKAF
ncbi:MAG: triose-phosphate isomerase [Nonlabens sp.]|nr:triose-phosphate isomerase [Nonlabens sp.]